MCMLILARNSCLKFSHIRAVLNALNKQVDYNSETEGSIHSSGKAVDIKFSHLTIELSFNYKSKYTIECIRVRNRSL